MSRRTPERRSSDLEPITDAMLEREKDRIAESWQNELRRGWSTVVPVETEEIERLKNLILTLKLKIAGFEDTARIVFLQIRSDGALDFRELPASTDKRQV